MQKLTVYIEKHAIDGAVSGKVCAVIYWNKPEFGEYYAFELKPDTKPLPLSGDGYPTDIGDDPII